MAKKKRPSGNGFSITLRRREIPIVRCMRRQRDLQFYTKNPRIYSLVWEDGEEPDQESIQVALGRMEHVKELVQSIRANGGVTDPLFVLDGQNTVLEGNSRLAAYRLLEKEDPLRWAEVKCDVIASTISEDDVFSLLTQYHIVGRKDWAPYEQAGIFWRRHKDEGISLEQIAQEVKALGLSIKRIRHWIAVYDMMVKHNDNSAHRWSYYDELLKSREIKKAREEHKNFDRIVVGKIKSGEIARADDVRKKVHKIAKAGGKTLNKFLATPKSLEDCFEKAQARGVSNVLLQKMHRFREAVVGPDAKDELLGMPENQQKKCVYEMKRIRTALSKWIKALGG